MASTVLIVEDNELNAKLFRDLLRAKGYATLEAGYGEQAMILARRHRPDLVLLDLQLPSISGYTVIRLLRADPTLRHTPVIGVSAFLLPSEGHQLIEAGFDDYVMKPISARELLSKVGALVRRCEVVDFGKYREIAG